MDSAERLREAGHIRPPAFPAEALPGLWERLGGTPPLFCLMPLFALARGRAGYQPRSG